MSDKPEKDQKVHDPSPERLRKAVEDGNILRAREILTVGMLAGGLGMVLVGAPHAFGQLQEVARYFFLQGPRIALTADTLPALLSTIAIRLVLALAPLFGVLAFLAVGLNVMQSGLHVTTKNIAPKFNRLNPASGFKRIFSVKGLFEAGKALFKLAVVGAIAAFYIRARLPELLGAHRLATPALLAQLGAWMLGLVVRCVGALVVMAVLDFVYEKRHRWNELKMTAEEVKREAKDSEGDPMLKGRRRAKAREMAKNRPRLMDAVLQADVVITNPTHYAVALKYDPVAGGAPRVLVKGMRKRALAIKALAREKGVPTVEDRPTARALYAAVPEGGEIPETLYAAVAAILAEVYRMRDRR